MVDWIAGGSGGSSQRENMGRFAHVFATLAVRHGLDAPTDLFAYSGRNEFRLVRRFAAFRAVDRELTGNYKADWSRTAELFAGRLLRIDPRTGRVRETRD